MKKSIFPQQWLDVHPYRQLQPTDDYYIGLANRLFAECRLSELPEHDRKNLCVYVAAYLEDVVSGLGLWHTFRSEYSRLYDGKRLPFYPLSENYYEDEINREDVCFIIWNTWQKADYPHPFIDPTREEITRLADSFMPLLDAAYEEAPENEVLENYFSDFVDEATYDKKLTWLFGHTYLTAPAMAPYIDRVAPTDRFIMPTGPIALFLHEWVAALSDNDDWRRIKGIIPPESPLPKEQQAKNRDYYARFTAACEGRNIVYLDSYPALRRFLVEVLGWKDDDQHTLPQMKDHRNFILMSNPEKGILLAKDICEWIADPANPLYDSSVAERESIRMLTEETCCPPDLLQYCIGHGYLPDLQFGEPSSREWVVPHADFIARFTLLYYYRGD